LSASSMCRKKRVVQRAHVRIDFLLQRARAKTRRRARPLPLRGRARMIRFTCLVSSARSPPMATAMYVFSRSARANAEHHVVLLNLFHCSGAGWHSSASPAFLPKGARAAPWLEHSAGRFVRLVGWPTRHQRFSTSAAGKARAPCPREVGYTLRQFLRPWSTLYLLALRWVSPRVRAGCVAHRRSDFLEQSARFHPACQKRVRFCPEIVNGYVRIQLERFSCYKEPGDRWDSSWS